MNGWGRNFEISCLSFYPRILLSSVLSPRNSLKLFCLWTVQYYKLWLQPQFNSPCKISTSSSFSQPSFGWNALVVPAQISNEEQREEKSFTQYCVHPQCHSACLNLYLFSIWQWMITLLQWYLLAPLQYGICHFSRSELLCMAVKSARGWNVFQRSSRRKPSVFFNYFFWNLANQFETEEVPKPKCTLLWIWVDNVVPDGDKYLTVTQEIIQLSLIFLFIVLT